MKRKGVCPVLTERNGSEKQKHIFIPQRPRCSNCREPHWSDYTLRCEREHPQYGRCNACGLEDHDLKFCDAQSMESGRGARIFSCSRGAKYHRDMMLGLIGEEMPGDWWLCKTHLPENVRERRRKSDERGRLNFEAEMAKNGWVGRGYEDILLDMSRWMAENTELVEEDEWLQQIAAKMADNQYLLEALGVETEDEF